MNDRFMLGTVLVEPSRRRLSAGGRALVIEPRVMDVISALAERNGDVVPRETLEALAWPGVHVGYHALSRAVSEARKGLEAVAPGEAIIETVPKRGYRISVRQDIAPSTEARPRPSVEFPVSRLAAGASAIVALGLVMHAADTHGSASHLVAAAITVLWTGWTPFSGSISASLGRR